MSLYDDTNPQHLLYLEQHRARWTPALERRWQAQVAAADEIAARTKSPAETIALANDARARIARASHVLEIAHG